MVTACDIYLSLNKTKTEGSRSNCKLVCILFHQWMNYSVTYKSQQGEKLLVLSVKSTLILTSGSLAPGSSPEDRKEK